MDRRGFFGLFAGLPFVSFLKEKRKVKLEWKKWDYTTVHNYYCRNSIICFMGKFAGSVMYGHKEFDIRLMTSNVFQLSKFGGSVLFRNGDRYRVITYTCKCKTIEEAKQWCVDTVKELAEENICGGEETLRALGVS